MEVTLTLDLGSICSLTKPETGSKGGVKFDEI